MLNHMLKTLALMLSLGTAATEAVAQTIAADHSIAIIPAVQNAAYASGNSLGGLQTVTAFRAVTPAAGIVNWLSVASKSGATPTVTAYIFDTNPASTTCTDKTAFALAPADLAKLVAAVPVTLTAPAGSTPTVGFAQNLALSIRNQDSPPSLDLYACLVAGGTVTPGSTSDIVVKLGLTQD